LPKRIANVKKNETKLTYDLTYKDVVDILEIIDHSTRGELHLELEDLKLTVVKKGGYGFSTDRLLEVRNIQRSGMTTKNENPSTTEDTTDLEK
jgi:hypothetical protein